MVTNHGSLGGQSELLPRISLYGNLNGDGGNGLKENDAGHGEQGFGHPTDFRGQMFMSVAPSTEMTNFPPSNIKFSDELATILGAWLKEHPVVETEEVARSGKLLVDRAKLCLQDMEDERKGRTAPLNEQIKSINDEYRSPRTILDKILFELKDRLDAWIKKEEQIRLAAAEEARKRVEKAERIAREAEAREREAASDARLGVESDIAPLTKEADAAFANFQRAEREAARAEKATDVKIGGGFKNALSTRFKESLVVQDPLVAVSIMGWSERLFDALRTDAREYRRQHGQLPRGIISQGERKV